MSFLEEFSTVDAVLRAPGKTIAVDAFALSLIKAERQIRKIFTHLIYQYPCFSRGDVPDLRKTLVANKRIYFEGFEKGIALIYPKPIRDLIGDRYETLRRRITESIEIRNKIFHGQLTDRNLSESDLIALASHIREWCGLLAHGAEAELRYDGFARNSFQKSSLRDLSERFLVKLDTIDAYRLFIAKNVARPK